MICGGALAARPPLQPPSFPHKRLRTCAQANGCPSSPRWPRRRDHPSIGHEKGRRRGATGPEPTSKRNRRGDRPAFVTTRRNEQGLGAAPQTHARPVRRRRRLGYSCAASITRTVPMPARASDQGFCEIAANGAALRRSQRIAGNSPGTALTRPRTSTWHAAPAASRDDGKSVIAIAAIAAKSPQALQSIPPSHGYVSPRMNRKMESEMKILVTKVALAASVGWPRWSPPTRRLPSPGIRRARPSMMRKRIRSTASVPARPCSPAT